MSEKILVRGVNWIGDAVMMIPALKGLRRAYPDSEVSLLVKPSVAPIFEKDPTIDEIILYEKRFQGIVGKLKLAQILRKKGFSKAILFQNAFDAALIAFLAGVPERIGYNRDGRGLLLTKPIPFNDEDRKVHHINYYLNLVAHLQIPNTELQTLQPNPPSPPFTKGGPGGFLPWIYLSLEERLSARSTLSELKRPILGINPGAAYGSAKRWLPGRFAEVAHWFIRDTGGSVVIFGGSPEVDIAEEIYKKINPELRTLNSEPNSFLNMAGKTSLRELFSLIAECDVFLSNDSGPMHIAYAVGTPLVALFGSTDPKLTGPMGDGNIVIKPALSCSPCFERTCESNDKRCMYAITSDEVFLAIKRILPDKPAVFFDRDGTLCEDVHYMSTWDNFRILPGVEDLVKLKAKGFKLIGVTNQSGIARGIVQEGFVREVNHLFIERFGFDDFSYCPHYPEEHCSCRKPEPGMLYSARSKHGIDLRKSYVIGDKEADMILARAVNAKGILVRTGQDKESRYADFVVDNLQEAMGLVK